MPKLSILILSQGQAELLESTLVSVLENRPADSEIVVAHLHPYNDPYELAGEVTFVLLPRGTSAIAALNRALDLCAGGGIHVLPAGAEVSSGWADAPLAHLRSSTVAAVAPLVVDAHRADRLVAAGVEYRNGGLPKLHCAGASADDKIAQGGGDVGTWVCCGFFARAALERCGPFESRFDDLAAAADWAARSRAAGYRQLVESRSVVRLPASALRRTDAFRAGLSAERLFARHHPGGVSFGRMAGHALAVMVECTVALPHPAALARLTGRTVGMLEWAVGLNSSRRQQSDAETTSPATEAANAAEVRIDRRHAAGTAHGDGSPSEQRRRQKSA